MAWSTNLQINETNGKYYDSSYGVSRIPYTKSSFDDILDGCHLVGSVSYNGVSDTINYDLTDINQDEGVWHLTQNRLYQYSVAIERRKNETDYYEVRVQIDLRRNENDDVYSIKLYETLYKKHTSLAAHPNPISNIYVDENNPFVLTKMDDFVAYVDNNIFSAQTVTQYVSLSKTTFTRADVLSYNGAPYNVEITYLYNDVFQQEITTYLTLYLETYRATGATINGSDKVQRYFLKEDGYFVTPVFVFEDDTKPYTFVYNNGTEKDISPSEILKIEYTETDSASADVLEDGASVIGQDVTKLYAHIFLTDGDDAFAPFSIYRKQDTVASIIADVDFDFVLGNKLEKYKNNGFSITAVWENTYRQNTTNFLNYTFSYTGIVMTSSDLGASTNIVIDGTTFAVDLTDMSYVEPDIDEVVIKENAGIKSSYQNEIERINLTDVILTVKYEDAEYTKDVIFSSTNTCDEDHFSVRVYNGSTQILNNVDYINGNDVLDLSDDVKIYNCEFHFNIENEFSNSTESSALTVPFAISSIKEIVGIKVTAYKDYKVGEAFLNDNDNTTVKLFFKAVENGTGVEYIDSVDVLLRDDIQTISVNYAKGTVWTQPDSSKTIVVTSVFDSNIRAEYTISVLYDGYVSGSNTKSLVVVWTDKVETPEGNVYVGGDEKNGVLAIYKEEDTYIDVDGVRKVYSDVLPFTKPLGYIKNIFNTKTLNSQAVMVLFDDYTAPIEGSANITIEYPCYDGLADNINKCTFGILFGNNNANNRLFVSGNPDISNADWHSAETNTVHSEGEVLNHNGDFSYFPNQNIMFYGETDNKVIGYDIVANDKLLVLKDKSDKEKTVYFRTPVMVTALDATGTVQTDQKDNTLLQEEFALVKGNNSVAGVSPHSIINFNGDTLFIDSDNTVEGLDLTGIVSDNQRYANTRSSFLDKKLESLDLSNAFLWTNNKYLFMPIENEGIYVTHVNAFNSETRQYDWWKIQGENPRCFVEIDNVVYFGNDNGELYRMRNGKFEDEYKVFVNEGQGILARINEEEYPKIIDGVEIPAESIVLNEDVFEKIYPGGEIDENRHLFFHSVNSSTTYKGSMFHQIASLSNNESDDVDLYIVEDDGTYYLEVTNDLEKQGKIILLLKENTEYYLNYYKEEGVQEVKCDQDSLFYNNYNNRFKLVYVSGYENDRYLMKIYNDVTQEWDDIDLADLYKANLVEKLDGEYEICEADYETKSFRLKDDNGELMNIVNYGDQGETSTFSAEIIERKNVVAYYITAPLTMGDINHFKTIWVITLSNDTGEPSEYDLAVASNKIPMFETKNISSVSKAKIGTNFLDFAFRTVDFDKNVVPRTYTIQRTMGMQKFVCLAFKNDNNTDAILSSLSVTYTIPFPSYGSD